MAITQTGEQTAIYCLQHNEWKLDQASDNYFQQPQLYCRERDMDQKKVDQLFRRYQDPNDPTKIAMDGVCRFLEDLDLDPTSKSVLIIAWKFRAETQCEFSRTEFVNGFIELGVDSIDSLRSKLPSLENELRDPNKFKDFYQFTFNYAKEDTQKGIDLEMAIAYWNIVLKGQFKFLEQWCEFLVVSSSRSFNRFFLSSTFFFIVSLSRRKITNDPFRKTHGIYCWILQRTSMTVCQIMMLKVRGRC